MQRHLTTESFIALEGLDVSSPYNGNKFLLYWLAIYMPISNLQSSGINWIFSVPHFTRTKPLIGVLGSSVVEYILATLASGHWSSYFTPPSPGGIRDNARPACSVRNFPATFAPVTASASDTTRPTRPCSPQPTSATHGRSHLSDDYHSFLGLLTLVSCHNIIQVYITGKNE